MPRPPLYAFALLVSLTLPGCDPEDGRPRGGGPGGDAGNYVAGRVHPPSKIDGTKDLRPLGRPSPAGPTSSPLR